MREEEMAVNVSSWGLSLFVLFERKFTQEPKDEGSWGLSLFVLFEPWTISLSSIAVLED